MTTIAIAIVGRAITLERKPSKRSKELIPKMMQRGLSDNCTRGNIEKSNIAIAILEK